MDLKSLTYTSFASLDLSDADLRAILQAARQLNALNGITGLLVFNGTHFLQIVEGPASSLDDLVDRLQGDPRHQRLDIRDERVIAERQFPDWSMELVHVSSRYFEAHDELASKLPEDLPDHVRERILKMTEEISGTVKLPD